VAIPSSHNLEVKHNEKILKYLALSVYLKNNWHLEKIVIVPVILSSTVIIPNSITKSLKILKLNKKLILQFQKLVLLYSCKWFENF
jgi:hypothetical protein